MVIIIASLGIEFVIHLQFCSWYPPPSNIPIRAAGVPGLQSIGKRIVTPQLSTCVLDPLSKHLFTSLHLACTSLSYCMSMSSMSSISVPTSGYPQASNATEYGDAINGDDAFHVAEDDDDISLEGLEDDNYTPDASMCIVCHHPCLRSWQTQWSYYPADLP